MTDTNPTNTLLEETPALHSNFEDILALLIGTFLVSFASMIMQEANILTGGTFGLALLTHYATGIRFGILFFLINIPFYYLAYKRLGMSMLIKTFVSITLLSIMTELHPLFIDLKDIAPLYACIIANVLVGIGILILFRHRSSLGGFNLLALYIQEYYKIPAGKILMTLDVCVLLLSLIYVSVEQTAVSIIGVVILNVIITLNHRSDRYIGT